MGDKFYAVKMQPVPEELREDVSNSQIIYTLSGEIEGIPMKGPLSTRLDNKAADFIKDCKNLIANGHRKVPCCQIKFQYYNLNWKEPNILASQSRELNYWTLEFIGKVIGMECKNWKKYVSEYNAIMSAVSQ